MSYFSKSLFSGNSKKLFDSLKILMAPSTFISKKIMVFSFNEMKYFLLLILTKYSFFYFQQNLEKHYI